ncbi:MAG: PliI family lysozyme inhibitor of I-type lysozyme [Planctomycetota bacterium]|nr:PliI family lysozyme inhibitor of I-type lysozyme [Planctomycetota bacterium]
MLTWSNSLRLAAGLILLAALGIYLFDPTEARAGVRGELFELGLEPGQEQLLLSRDLDVTLRVPAGEGHSIGTMVVAPRSPDEEPQTELVLERDGGLEAAWLADLDGDRVDDLLLVTRSAGSGGYLALTLLRSHPEGLEAELLPGLSASDFPGYRGHGRVEVLDGVIELEFPLYGDHLEVADRPLETIVKGELPVTLEDDPNARPTDGKRRVRFDLAAGEWR